MFSKQHLITLFLIITTASFAQVTGFIDDFNDGNIDGWVADHERTFQLSNEDNALKINYTRTAESGAWDNFNFTPPDTIDISSKPVINISIKSDFTTVLSIKPTNGVNVPLIALQVEGDGMWHDLTFKITAEDSKTISKMYLYFDGGSSTPANGIIYLDNIAFGDSSYLALDYTELNDAISVADKLLENAVEGTNEGEYETGAKAGLQTAINYAYAFFELNSEDKDELNQVIWDVYDACVTFETSVNSVYLNLVDDNATKETKYLYLNLEEIQERSLIFGMHDATGYGVGWTGDNDRSDVKDVVGDYPALYSEDLNKIQNDGDVEGVHYRLTSAYDRGGIITMSWHEYDPDGRGFYDDDVNFEPIVSYILPGGPRHQEYRALLHKIALFFKKLRGSNGESVPVIFRPYHEHTGSWFWWGESHRTTGEYNELWQFTVEYLRDSLNVHNLLYALSPSFSDVVSGEEYYNTYPGDDYVDIFGTDKYFSTNPVPESENTEFLNGIKTIVGLAKDKDKIMAITEVGNEGLTIQNWFTETLMNPIKNDETARNVSYAAVWRNANSTHHFAPYPGDPSVPDFINFYNDPFTIFESDLPPMYVLPADDEYPPVFLSQFDSLLVSTSTDVLIEVETDERAFLRYGYSNETYDNLSNSFTFGEGSYRHSVTIESEQGAEETIYIQARDDLGNTTGQPLVITYVVDTLQTPIAWYDPRYPDSDWSAGLTPIGTDADNVTMSSNARTVYFRKEFTIPSATEGLGIQIRCKGGTAFYLNGTEILRISLPPTSELKYNTDPINFNQITQTVTLKPEYLSLLHEGSNLLAAEVHSPEGESVGNFDVRAFDATYTAVIEYGSQWSFYDLGDMPADKTLGEITGVEKTALIQPAEFDLKQNYPNPFNPTTTIEYQIPALTPRERVSEGRERVVLLIYDILGREVAKLVDEYQAPGTYKVIFDASSVGRELASGMYAVVLNAGNSILTHKMMLVK